MAHGPRPLPLPGRENRPRSEPGPLITLHRICRALSCATTTLLLVAAAPGMGQDPDELRVNTANDLPDTSPGDGLCHTSAGNCSLRAAITEANDPPSQGVAADQSPVSPDSKSSLKIPLRVLITRTPAALSATSSKAPATATPKALPGV